MIFAANGYLTPVAGAVGQEIIDVLAVLNALRSLSLKGSFREMKASEIWCGETNFAFRVPS